MYEMKTIKMWGKWVSALFIKALKVGGCKVPIYKVWDAKCKMRVNWGMPSVFYS